MCSIPKSFAISINCFDKPGATPLGLVFRRSQSMSGRLKSPASHLFVRLTLLIESHSTTHGHVVSCLINAGRCYTLITSPSSFVSSGRCYTLITSPSSFVSSGRCYTLITSPSSFVSAGRCYTLITSPSSFVSAGRCYTLTTSPSSFVSTPVVVTLW